jgi:hypothetical protein
MNSRDQLAFWPTATGGPAIVVGAASYRTARLNPRRDDITVINEWTNLDVWESAGDIIPLMGSADWRKARSKSNYLLAKAAPASIAALIRIAFAQRETLSLDWLSAREHVLTRPMIRDVELGGKRLHTKSLASSFMRIELVSEI